MFRSELMWFISEIRIDIDINIPFYLQKSYYSYISISEKEKNMRVIFPRFAISVKIVPKQRYALGQNGMQYTCFKRTV